jgi:L-ascorbate metabolism protein UlaG (beta-lactamase superfamily)
MKQVCFLAVVTAIVGIDLTSALSVAQTAQDDSLPTSNGNLAIHAVHHGSLVLTLGGKRLVVDPSSYPPDPEKSAAAEFRGPAPPDLILITHEHADHFSVMTLSELVGPKSIIVAPQDVFDKMPPALQDKAKVMKNGDHAVYAGVPIEAVPAYNVSDDRRKYHPKGRDNGYVLTLGGKRIYIAGDTEETPELKNLPNIDAAFIPMNLPYTETAEAAAAWVKDFKPKLVYPYHTRGMPSGDVNTFKAEVGGASEVRLLKWY